MRVMWPFIEEDYYPECVTQAFADAVTEYQAALAAIDGKEQG
jgi:hypothetical protein